MCQCRGMLLTTIYLIWFAFRLMQRTIHLKGVKPTFEVSIAFPVQLRIVVYDKTFHIRYHRYYYKISSMPKLRGLPLVWYWYLILWSLKQNDHKNMMTHICNGIKNSLYFPILKYADLFDQYFSTSLFWGMYFTFMSSWKAV